MDECNKCLDECQCPSPILAEMLKEEMQENQPTNGMSDEAFRDHAIIAIYAGKVARGDWGQACMESACRDADALLAERNRRRDERQKGGA